MYSQPARFYTVFYFENLINIPVFHLKKKPDGTLLADWPVMWSDGLTGGFSVAESGAYVLEAFKKPQEWIGEVAAHLYHCNY